MSGKLIVKNFGPIKEAKIDLKKAMVFIGPQASGKSTIAKLIAIFKNQEIDYSMSQFHSELKKFQIEEYFNKDTYIKYSNDFYSVIYSHLAKDSLFGHQQQSHIKRRNYYIPAERNFYSLGSGKFLSLISHGVPIVGTLLDFGGKVDIAKDKIKTISLGITEGLYKFIDGEDRIYLTKKSKSYIQLAQSASGIQALIPMKILIEANYSNPEYLICFILEEPELNLFPTAQYELVKELVEKCTWADRVNGYSNELLITTHSPYILTSINNSLAAHKVANKFPSAKNKIKKIIPEKSWLNSADFAAYYFKNGRVKSIFDKKSGLISGNELDEASEDIMDDFDQIMSLYREAMQ